MSGREILKRLGCFFGRHQWSAWSVHRAAGIPGHPPLWKTRRCMRCPQTQETGVFNSDQIGKHDRDHHHNPTLYFDPG